MYKSYPREDYIRVMDECAERVRSILQTRYDELEDLRDAINDRYPFEDLFLKWAEVDDEEEMIRQFLMRLEECSESMKERVMSETNNVDFEDYKEQIKIRMDILTEQEKQIVSFRFGLEDGQPKTLDETAEKFGITPTRVRQIEAKAKRKDSTKGAVIRQNKLKDFLD